MRQQLRPRSRDVGAFVKDDALCSYAVADDIADTFPTWCSFCLSQHRQSDGMAQPSRDSSSQRHEDYANNLDDGCPMFPVRAEIVRESIIAILADLDIADHRQCCPDADAAITFEARLRTMMQAAIRRNPGTTAFSFDHVLRRFVPDEWD